MSRLFLQNTPLASFEREMMAKPGFGRRRIKETEDDDITPPWEESPRITENPYEAYRFPVGDGCFVGTLVMKKWNRCDGLMAKTADDTSCAYGTNTKPAEHIAPCIRISIFPSCLWAQS